MRARVTVARMPLLRALSARIRSGGGVEQAVGEKEKEEKEIKKFELTQASGHLKAAALVVAIGLWITQRFQVPVPGVLAGVLGLLAAGHEEAVVDRRGGYSGGRIRRRLRGDVGELQGQQKEDQRR